MKTLPPLANRHTKAREATLRHMAQLGPFLEGSLSPFKRPGCTQPGWHLTFKQKGHPRTVYVPVDLAAQVKRWTRNCRHLKKLIREVTRHSLALIHRHVAKPAGRPALPGLDGPLTAQALVRVVRAVFPRLNDWFNALPDPRVQEMCVQFPSFRPSAWPWWSTAAGGKGIGSRTPSIPRKTTARPDPVDHLTSDVRRIPHGPAFVAHRPPASPSLQTLSGRA